MTKSFAIIIGLFTLVSCINNVQEKELEEPVLKEHFEADIYTYLKEYDARNFEVAFDMVYPRIYEFISREQLMQYIYQLEELGMVMHTEFKSIDEVSEIIEYNNAKYCRVHYHASITIQISNEMLEKKDGLFQQFMAEYGSDNVKYDENEQRFSIDARKSMIAVMDVDADRWKYIEYGAQQKSIIVQIIPSVVLKQIGN